MESFLHSYVIEPNTYLNHDRNQDAIPLGVPMGSDFWIRFNEMVAVSNDVVFPGKPDGLVKETA